MGTGAEGEIRPCAWKWEWKLKSRIENEEGGPHGHVMAGQGGAASRRGERGGEIGERERKERPVERSGHSIACGVVSALYMRLSLSRPTSDIRYHPSRAISNKHKSAKA